jgi:catechol-2,3-dioxygenase
MLNDATLYSVLPAQDIDRLKTFLSEKLDLEPIDEQMGMLIYEVGGSKLLVYESTFAGTNQATAISLEVDDLEMIVDDLKSKGVVFEHYDMPGGSIEGDIHTMKGVPAKSVWFKDSEDNIINLNQSA